MSDKLSNITPINGNSIQETTIKVDSEKVKYIEDKAEAKVIATEIIEDLFYNSGGIEEKYPDCNEEMIVFYMWHNLAEHLWSPYNWRTAELVAHLIEHFEERIYDEEQMKSKFKNSFSDYFLRRDKFNKGLIRTNP